MKNILIVSAVLVLVGAGCVGGSSIESELAEVLAELEEEMVADDLIEVIVFDEVEVEAEVESEPVAASLAGTYTNYSKDAVASGLLSDETVVLFFHANWCHFCLEADADFRAHIDEIPAGVKLLKTDYDTQKALKGLYGVKYQHTFVKLDASGGAADIWVGGGYDELVDHVE
ncbi:hypothetical protein HOI18_02960 [Candidatus Uhrbacteria bacterium]|jgi:hypothetical protein|nr:hypothetical protein [Candidatus Uhrbacteria bacterium]